MNVAVSNKVSVQTKLEVHREAAASGDTRTDYGRLRTVVRVRSPCASFGRVRAGFMAPIMTLTYRLREGPEAKPRRI